MAIRVAGRAIVADPRSAWRAVRLEAEQTPRPLRAWFALLAVLLLIGAFGALRALIPGDKGIATTPTFEWGLLIVGYVFFAVTTSGLCLTSSLGTVFGIDRFRPLEKRHAVLALLCLLTALGIIALDLHYPVRLVFGVVFSPAPSSPMWWMGVAYGVYLVFLVTEVWSIFWRHPRIHAWACVLASGMAVIAPSTLGAVFGVLVARPVWAGVFSPLLMLGTGFLSGTALLGLVFYPVARFRLAGFERATRLAIPAVRSVLALALCIVSWLVARQVIVGSASADAGLLSATRALTGGPLAVGFVGVRVIGGLLLPTVLLLLPWTRRTGGIFVASLLILIGVFADRLSFVSAGQIAPTTVTSGVVSAPYAAYTPSPVEIGILVGAVAFVATAYTLAERYLDLRESEVHIGLWQWLPGYRPEVTAWSGAPPEPALAAVTAEHEEAPAEIVAVELTEAGPAEPREAELTEAVPAEPTEAEPAEAELTEAEPAEPREAEPTQAGAVEPEVPVPAEPEVPAPVEPAEPAAAPADDEPDEP